MLVMDWDVIRIKQIVVNYYSDFTIWTDDDCVCWSNMFCHVWFQHFIPLINHKQYMGKSTIAEIPEIAQTQMGVQVHMWLFAQWYNYNNIV